MRIRHYPRPVCDACYSMEVAWIEASGRGRVHSAYAQTPSPLNRLGRVSATSRVVRGSG